MSLIKCKECQSEISNNAKKCPNCGIGSPGTTGKETAKGCLSIFSLMIIISLLMTFCGDQTITLKEDQRIAKEIKTRFIGDLKKYYSIYRPLIEKGIPESITTQSINQARKKQDKRKLLHDFKSFLNEKCDSIDYSLVSNNIDASTEYLCLNSLDTLTMMYSKIDLAFDSYISNDIDKNDSLTMINNALGEFVYVLKANTP